MATKSFTQTITSQTMGVDLTATVAPAPETLETLSTDLLLIVIRMREAEDLGDPRSLKKLIQHYIGLFESNCRSIGTSEQHTRDAMYALVALLDETVLSAPGPCRDVWLSSPLQLEYFGDNIAGEGFFRRLDALREQSDVDDVLGIYYLCLSLGFEGKYRIMNPEERGKIIAGLAERLGGGREKKRLSPHAFRPMSTLGKSRSGFTLIPLWMFGAFGATATAVLWISLYLMSGSIG